MKYYFILDSKTGTLSVFDTLEQLKCTQTIIVCQCLMSPQSDYSNVNPDIEKKFEA